MAFRKYFFKRAVIAKARSDVAPFRKHRLIWRAASDVAADGHRAQCASVIALAARKHAVTRGLPFFQMVLADKFDSRLGRFRTTGRKVNAAASSKIWRSNRK